MIFQPNKASQLFPHGPSGVLRQMLMLLIRAYQKLLSPLLGPACRYYPSCSNYALQAIENHGCMKGCFLAIRRVLRCNPLASGGFDPVPESTNHRECKNH